MTLFEWSSILYDASHKSIIQDQSVIHFDRAIDKGFYPPNILHSRASLALDQEDIQVSYPGSNN